jgi:hypothetical protein
MQEGEGRGFSSLWCCHRKGLQESVDGDGGPVREGPRIKYFRSTRAGSIKESKGEELT